MNALFHEIVGILKLRSGPQDLPSSWSVCLAIVAIYLMLGVITGQSLGGENSVAAALAAAAMQFVLVIVMLQIRKYPERLTQTLSAIASAGIVFTVLSFGFLSMADPERQQPLLALGWFSIFFWSLVVDAHIYKNALSITMAQGMLVAVLLLAGSYVLVEFTFN
jgi:hypothetical protein